MVIRQPLYLKKPRKYRYYKKNGSLQVLNGSEIYSYLRNKSLIYEILIRLIRLNLKEQQA